jgi:hypothetical protein
MGTVTRVTFCGVVLSFRLFSGALLIFGCAHALHSSTRHIADVFPRARFPAAVFHASIERDSPYESLGEIHTAV